MPENLPTTPDKEVFHIGENWGDRNMVAITIPVRIDTLDSLILETLLRKSEILEDLTFAKVVDLNSTEYKRGP